MTCVHFIGSPASTVIINKYSCTVEVDKSGQSETSVHFYQSMLHHTPERSHFIDTAKGGSNVTYIRSNIFNF
jgi:hypothetical protein